MRDIDSIDLVETIREGLLVLEQDLTVVFANRSFCRAFAVSQEETIGRKLYELGNGQWDIPELRTLMEAVLPQQTTIEAYQVEWVFPTIGHRVMLLNARTVYRPAKGEMRILLAIQDVTEQVRLEREQTVAHERIAVLLQELGHRIKNNLQIIASIVGLEARALKEEEGKRALEKVSQRIAAVAHLHTVLAEADRGGEVDAAIYLKELIRDLATSLQKNGAQHIGFDVEAVRAMLPVERAVPLGLIVNELVTNATKYAFREAGGSVKVSLERLPGQLRLTVADDGKGIDPKRSDSGLGSRLVEAFTLQLGGLMERESDDRGTKVSLVLPWQDTA